VSRAPKVKRSRRRRALDDRALIRDGLKHAETLALVKVMGALSRLPSDRARKRALQFVADKLAEEKESKP
jgi:hypothetical protein